jgi:hypothetical protein
MTKQRKSWLARKLGRLRTSLIADLGLEADIEALVNYQTLTNSSSSTAFLDSSEIQEGNVLGEGEYSLVYSISGFALDIKNSSSDSNSTTNKHHNHAGESPQEAAQLQQRRKQLQENALNNGLQQYAIKRMNKKYLKGDKTLLKRGSIKLITEARVLSLLQGETTHIVSLRALQSDVLEGCRDFEDFFILTDRLNDTLAKRIRRWRKESTDKGEAPNDDLIPMKSNYAYQIANAIKACHDHGIMVRRVFFCVFFGIRLISLVNIEY